MTQMENMLIISTFGGQRRKCAQTTALILVVLSGRRFPEAVSTIYSFAKEQPDLNWENPTVRQKSMR